MDGDTSSPAFARFSNRKDAECPILTAMKREMFAKPLLQSMSGKLKKKTEGMTAKLAQCKMAVKKARATDCWNLA